ncbi:hypothetical protein [Helicobacter sp. 11S02629-2]|uniref:hypothetical protein n=1 Tax=Helicobacter sp. 11S02629-2 TaxID=1476195 RepID=UPI000BA5FD35|nr:hypothetical protein [Helicobacter sp. 11S02629-2]PAF45652.1 hypothetical protein BKH40_01865 [Helicobacter sp. 11S02629-2]
MKELRSHISLLIPLIALLFGIQIIMLVQRSLDTQESHLVQDYSIMIASKQPLTIESLQDKIVEAKSLDTIDPEPQLDRLKQSIGDISIFKKDLPYFYSLNLEYFPNKARLDAITSILKKVPNVIRVESFAKSYTQVYGLLTFIKFSISIFAVVVFIVSVLLMLKQIAIWKYQHAAKMEVMDILGASVWIRNRHLFKLAFIDSFIASIITILIVYYLSDTDFIRTILESLGIGQGVFEGVLDFIRLVVIALIVSNICVILVIFSKSKN